MVSGLVRLEGQEAPTEIQRGTPLYSREGEAIGKVAALMVDGRNRLACDLIIFRLPEVPGYWKLPVERIASIENGRLWLDISMQDADQLPAWHAGG